MKIIKQGNLKAKSREFSCLYCSSVFIADAGEYGHKSHIDRGERVEQYWCDCPVCSNRVEEWVNSKVDEQQIKFKSALPKQRITDHIDNTPF